MIDKMKTMTPTMGLALTLGLTACGGADLGGDGNNGSSKSTENNGYANNGAADMGHGGANNGGTNNGYANNGTSYADAGMGAPEEDYNETENYGELVENDWVDTTTENTSTFSIDVDNASYTIMRRDLNNGILPQPESVRTEEYINYFEYDYPQPAPDQPFSINLEVAPSRFGDDKELLRIGVQGRDIPVEDMKPTNMVFLIDISGSMSSEKKLPLVKKSLHILLDNLRPTDTVGIVTYASGASVALQPTTVSNKQKITNVIDALTAGGSTYGEGGIVEAYQLAEQAKIEGGNNRVLIASDGDFNVGKTGEDLVQLIQSYRQKHISLTLLGYGMGNLNDHQLESLARDGNGNYFYIDTLDEASRLFGPTLPSMLEVIAADVKIQVEFESETVLKYRLVGYENRILDNEDFENDKKDAGEIGPGHEVTALYELEVDHDAPSSTGLLAEVRLRHKEQYGEESIPYAQSIKLSQIKSTFEEATDDFRFAAAVAEFAEILRKSKHSEGDDFDSVKQVASDASRAGDATQSEFSTLVEKAQGLWTQ